MRTRSISTVHAYVERRVIAEFGFQRSLRCRIRNATGQVCLSSDLTVSSGLTSNGLRDGVNPQLALFGHWRRKTAPQVALRIENATELWLKGVLAVAGGVHYMFV